MRWVKVEDVGDTSFLLEEQVDKFRFREENDQVIKDGGRPATGRPLLLGITKASLRPTRSFPPQASRRPRASSRKPRSPARSITSAASRKTSSWAA